MTQSNTPPPLRAAVLNTAFRVAFVVGIAVGVNFLFQWVESLSHNLQPGAQDAVMGSVIVLMILAYAMLMAIPFVPGIELGILLMAMRGADIAGFVYLATISGLLAAFFVGRYVSYDWLRKVLLDLHLSV